MTDLSLPQRRAVALAAAEGHAFALWRMPRAAGFTLAVSDAAPAEGPVFAADPVPAFAMAPFAAPDGSRAILMPADVLLTPDAMLFREGTALMDAPSTAFHRAVAAGRAPAPFRAPPDDLPAPVATARPDYEALVTRALEKIRTGRVDKIVLSRIEPRDLEPGHDLLALAEALSHAHPHAFVTLASSAATGTWIAATPEVLLTASPEGLSTMALAGTQWPGPGVDIAKLTWPAKIVEEQEVVSRFIRAAFAAAGIADVTETPAATVRAANLCHLRSDFSAPAAAPEAMAALLAHLHPTSAVCGLPKPEAREFILAEEGAARGFYTGYLGPVAIGGVTALHVNLRSARVAGERIFLHVGGGIVEGSDPALEWEETVQKTKTIGAVLAEVRG